MSEPIIVVDSSEIREGSLEAVKSLVDELVRFVEANEADPLAYGVYFDEAGRLMTVVQVHPSSASMERHMEIAAPVFRKFRDLLVLERVDIYGEPTETLLELTLEKARLLGGAPVAVHALHAGFARFAASVDARSLAT